MKIGHTVFALLVACAVRDSAQVLPAGPGRIVLIRHGEEPSDVSDPPSVERRAGEGKGVR